jgi:peroxiredoxin
MAATESAMLELGTQAPHFSLTDVRDGKVRASEDLQGPKGLLVMFICAHCPFVKHVEQELAKLGADYQHSGVGIVAISSNDAQNYPGDSPAGLAAQAGRLGFVFPYLYDESQEVAHAYAAACTPDFFLFDGMGKLVYRGQLDASRPSNGVPVTGKDLRAALDALVAGRSISTDQYPSIGCNIKWK